MVQLSGKCYSKSAPTYRLKCNFEIMKNVQRELAIDVQIDVVTSGEIR